MVDNEKPPSPATGVFAMVGAAVIWGLFPLYLHLFKQAGTDLIMAHRIIWCVPMVWTLVWLGGKKHQLNRKRFRLLICSALLLGGMWLAYVWSITNHRLIDLSLGYFLMPLLATLMGVLWFGERLSGQERIAVGLAAAGLALLAVSKGGLPLNGILFALSFGGYATLRKKLQMEPLLAFAVEVSLLAPFALAYLAYQSNDAFTELPLQVGSAVLTLLPMVLYGLALTAIRLATASMINYLTPTLNFLCGLLFFAEPLEPLKLVTFVFIWSGLLVYTHAAIQRSRNGKT